ncbi:uncharacterized protein LOC133180655 [Saccostrea echinata]|uniref:uncharacterized protein LOC133180655 n=1 Tax=Saccostrea echinata TaxID=191078 RepID=UPI002A80EE88|nr:uncharacterized protein LOC133180655 [Saccostrea echinata]
MSCPKCNCDDFCPITGECCIDIEVNTCVRTSYGPEWPDKMFYMKNYCPSNTEKKLVSRCQATNANENMLERNPVTSKSTNITYSNIYCARCNNDVNVLSWSIATNCIIKLDTFTTLDELWNYILNGHLSFMFIPTEEIRTNSQVPRSCNANLINRCNITGVAKQFDYNIEKACNTLYQPIGFFQNPFCLLCNIQDETFDSPISKCNATGRIQEIDDYFRSSCLNETVNALRYPYKNEYCEECNIVRTESGDIQLRDTELTVHIYNRPVQKFLRLKTQNQVYLSEVTIGAFDFTENYSISQYLGKIKLGSIKNLQIKIPANAADFGWKKKKKWCQTAKKYFFPDNENLNPLIYEPSCSCNSNCSKLDNCCDVKGSIMNQVKKWSCVQTSLPRSNDFYSNPSFMISRCSNKYNNSVIKRLCESDNNEDLTFIPVTDSRTIKTYKNYFCFLCFTSNKNSVEEQTYIIPWKMHFECPNIFSFKYDVKLVSLMQEALSRNCRISVLPYLPYPPPMCELPGREQLYCSLCERSGKMVENCIRTNQKEPDYRSIFSVFEKVDSTRAEDPRMQCSTYEMFDMYTVRPLYFTQWLK